MTSHPANHAQQPAPPDVYISSAAVEAFATSVRLAIRHTDHRSEIADMLEALAADRDRLAKERDEALAVLASEAPSIGDAILAYAIDRVEKAEAERDRLKSQLEDCRHTNAITEWNRAAEQRGTDAITEERDKAIEAMRRLLFTAKLLFANSEACVANHHGINLGDQYQNAPGWLADCRKNIEIAEEALRLAEPARDGGDQKVKAKQS